MRMPRRVLPPVFAALLVPWLAVATPAEGPDNGGAGSPPAPVADGGPVEIDVAPDRLPLDEIRRYVSVYRTVQQAYVEDVEDRALMQAAIRGLLSDLDPHSAYLDHEEALSMTEQATGAYDGIGVELVQQPDRSLLVVAAIDGTPAARAGLRNGDVITAIDGQPVNVDHVDGAIRTLRGAPGTRVELLVLRPGEAGPIAVTVVRERIRITSVRSRMLEPGFGYLRISLFQAETATDVARALDAMAAEGGGPIAGLVLDLRSNPGGLLNAAVEVADLFLDGGVIVSTRGRLPFANSRFSASPGDRLEGTPIVALIDSGTASAAEVLAGALRDHRRARVMGNRSFGKGSVQTVLPLDNGDSLKLTTARYYTPDEHSIQARGIRPDLPLVAIDGNGRRAMRETDLPRHLVNGTVEDEDGVDEHDEDRVLAAAVEALRQIVAGTLEAEPQARREPRPARPGHG